MAIKKIYDVETVKGLIERANNSNINKYKLVRNDVTNAQFNQKKIRPAQRNQSIPENVRYPGARDVGHVFRHVEGTEKAGKSTYNDANTGANVTCQILNSQEGQDALQTLDGENLELYDNTTKRVTATITGAWYGKSGNSTNSQKIKTARCELMKLGSDILWIHSSYPNSFQTSP